MYSQFWQHLLSSKFRSVLYQNLKAMFCEKFLLLVAVSLLLSTINVLNAQVAPELAVGVLPSLFVHGNHYSIGQQTGYFTRNSIYFRLRKSGMMQDIVKWVNTTSEGKAAYEAMLATATKTFPEYVDEIHGMAYGSGVDFQTLFILNVRSELGVFKSNSVNKTYSEIEHCSDYSMNNMNAIGSDGTKELIIAHNEDGGWEDRDNSYLITAHIEGDGVREEIRVSGKKICILIIIVVIVYLYLIEKLLLILSHLCIIWKCKYPFDTIYAL